MFVGADRMHYRRPMGARCWTARRAVVLQRGPQPARRSPRRSQQAGELDYAPAFQMGHPKAFELANRLRDMAPEPFEHVFFTNSGSESRSKPR
jgi:beta-alanine--pyruvate transaminase